MTAAPARGLVAAAIRPSARRIRRDFPHPRLHRLLAPATEPKPKARVSRGVALVGGTATRGWGSGGGAQGAASSLRGGC
jgi:hypothetical protein